MNGQLYAEYQRIGNMLGLPPCSNSHWHRIVKWLGEYVTKLAQWSCEQVREQVKEHGDQEAWVTSFDGYYLTRGHHSNNSSATLHDYATGNIAWFTHRTKRGAGHNWEGTSGGAEADMYDEILLAVKEAGFNISEVVTDKDSSMNAIYCRYFPEGTITYCSNHSAKTFHKDLLKVKQMKCQVCGIMHIGIHMYICTCSVHAHTCTAMPFILQCKAEGLPRCKRMSEAFINSCKAALKSLICSDTVFDSEDPYTAFSTGIVNFHSHYCLDDHSSPWCYHEKVYSTCTHIHVYSFT